jgi:IclR family acetate operon transcriptional repressor
MSAARSTTVQSVARALELLETVEAAGGVMTITELTSETGLPIGTIHRLAQALVTGGYLRQLPDRRYCLGSRLVALGSTANSLIGMRARPQLRELAAELGETANLAVLTASSAQYVAQVSGSHSMRMFTEVGRRVPLHSTGVGKALLSLLPDHEVLRVLDQEGMAQQTENTITDPDAMLHELAIVRERGYSMDEGEMELGVRCVAVPFRAASLSAVSISGPSVRMTSALVERAVESLFTARDLLVEQLDDGR